MTTHSPIQLRSPLAISNKGSIYGKAFKTPSPNSFQQLKRGYRSVLQNRVEVLPGQVTTYSTYSTMTHDITRDPKVTRDSKA